MKIAWLSNAAWASTGYGNQTKLFAPRLQTLGHELAILAFYGLEGAVLNWGGMPVYPRGYHPYGQDVASAHARHFGAKLIISLMDAWVCDPGMLTTHGTVWAPWFPVDHEPLPARIRERVAAAYRRFVFSRFGERQVQEAGLDCSYIPHGVDCKAFIPLDTAKARERLRWPQDRFIVGMVAANKGNPSRKAFTQQIEAFARFHKRRPDSLLYLHTIKAEHGELQGVNLPELVDYLGISDAVLWADQYISLLGFPDDYMCSVYSAMDVHLLVSMGEGFGIPVLEAQACGCPVIVGAWTAMDELCFSGWRVRKAEADPYWTPLAAYQYLPRIGPIVDRLERAYQAKGDVSLRVKARQGAEIYDADRVTQEYWRPALDELELELGAPEQILLEKVAL